MSGPNVREAWEELTAVSLLHARNTSMIEKQITYANNRAAQAGHDQRTCEYCRAEQLANNRQEMFHRLAYTSRDPTRPK